MKNLGLRSPCDRVGGLVYFGRMVDQIRAHAKGQLPPDYQASLGKGLDEHCVDFLGVTYELVVEYVNSDLSDDFAIMFWDGTSPFRSRDLHVERIHVQARLA